MLRLAHVPVTVLLTAALTFVQCQTNADPYCTPQTAAPGSKTMPDVFGSHKAFRAQYQISIISKKMTAWAEELYDETQQKVGVKLAIGGDLQSYILDYKNNLVIQIDTPRQSDGVPMCNIGRLNTTVGKNDNLHFFGYVRHGHSASPYAIHSLFDFGHPESFIYQTKDANMAIDGVPTDHWQTCLSWPDDNDVFTLDYYFSTVVEDGVTYHIPIRSEVKGEKQTRSRTTVPIHIEYDYFDFVPYQKLDPGNFAIPPNAICTDPEGLVTKPLPSVPDTGMSISLELEVVDIKDNSLTNKMIFYDTAKSAIVIQEDSVTNIYDYTTSTLFKIVSRGNGLKTCTPTIIPNVKSTMPSVEDLLFFNPKKQYQHFGKIIDRGITVDTWKGDGKIVNYMVDGWINNEPSLIKLPVTISDSKQRINIITYKIAPHYLNHNPFDLTSCADESHMKQFRVTLTSQVDIEAHGRPVLFRQSIITQLRDLTQKALSDTVSISPLYIYATDVFASERYKEFYFDGILLTPKIKSEEGSTSHTYERNLTNDWNKITKYIKQGTISLSIPVPKDIQNYLIPNLKAVVLNISRIDDSEKLYETIAATEKKQPISHFKRYKNQVDPHWVVMGQEKTTHVPNDCAALCLQQKIFECRAFRFCATTMQCQLASNLNRNNVNPNVDCDTYARDFTADFIELPGYQLASSSSELFLGLSNTNECASVCLFISSFVCKSFDYCSASEECFLEKERDSTLELSKIRQNTNAVCRHYAVNFLSDFTATAKTRISFDKKTHSSGTIVSDGGSEQCASLCASGSGAYKDCVQFDFCTDSRQCKFVPKSAKFEVKTKESKTCTLYQLSTMLNSKSSSSAQTNPPGEMYNGKSMIALGVCISLVGALLACVIIVIIARRKGLKIQIR